MNSPYTPGPRQAFVRADDLNPFHAVQARAQPRAPAMPNAALAAALADKAMREADPLRAVGDLSDNILAQARGFIAERLRRDLADDVRRAGV
jgi:hypothetical protein